MNNLAFFNEDSGEILNMGRATVKHNWVISSLSDVLKQHIDEHCNVFSEQSYKWAKDDAAYRIPDISVACNPTTSNGKDLDCIPWFIAEVLSDSTEKIDRDEKMNMYGKVGVQEYWIIDPEGEAIEQYANQNGKMILQGQRIEHPTNIYFLTHKNIVMDVTNIFDCKIILL